MINRLIQLSVELSLLHNNIIAKTSHTLYVAVEGVATQDFQPILSELYRKSFCKRPDIHSDT